jgi:hypothetical protein
MIRFALCKRDLIVPGQYAKRVNAGGGMLHPTLLVADRAVGTWKGLRKKDQMDVLAEPFEQLAPEVYSALKAEMADLARFLAMKTSLYVTKAF